MKFTLESSASPNVIRGYGEGQVRIGERTFERSCIVSAEHVGEWNVASSDSLTPADLEPVLALRPEVVVLGTGRAQRFPPAAVRAAFAARGVGLEVMDMGAACRTYNILIQEERRVVAALIVEARG